MNCDEDFLHFARFAEFLSFLFIFSPVFWCLWNFFGFFLFWLRFRLWNFFGGLGLTCPAVPVEFLPGFWAHFVRVSACGIFLPVLRSAVLWSVLVDSFHGFRLCRFPAGVVLWWSGFCPGLFLPAVAGLIFWGCAVLVCNGDCFNCVYPDCINDDIQVTSAERAAAAAVDRSALVDRLGGLSAPAPAAKKSCSPRSPSPSGGGAGGGLSYYQRHKAERLAYARKRYEQKKEELRAYQRLRYYERREALRAYQRLRYYERCEELKEYQREYNRRKKSGAGAGADC